MQGAHDTTDPSLIAGLKELATAMEDGEAELRARTQILKAEIQELAERTAYLNRLSVLLAELLPLIEVPASPGVHHLRVAVVDIRAGLDRRDRDS